jgi:hypothetical protein
VRQAMARYVLQNFFIGLVNGPGGCKGKAGHCGLCFVGAEVSISGECCYHDFHLRVAGALADEDLEGVHERGGIRGLRTECDAPRPGGTCDEDLFTAVGEVLMPDGFCVGHCRRASGGTAA